MEKALLQKTNRAQRDSIQFLSFHYPFSNEIALCMSCQSELGRESAGVKRGKVMDSGRDPAFMRSFPSHLPQYILITNRE